MQNPKNPKFKAYWLWLTTLSVQYMHCTRTALCLDGLRQREWDRQERRRLRQERLYISRASRLNQATGAQECVQTIQHMSTNPKHDQPTFRLQTQLHLCWHTLLAQHLHTLPIARTTHASTSLSLPNPRACCTSANLSSWVDLVPRVMRAVSRTLVCTSSSDVFSSLDLSKLS